MSTPNPFADPGYPNLADFTVYVYNQGVPLADMPADSLWLQWAYNYAFDVTMSAPAMPSILYVLAVYNMGMHRLLQTAQDLSGQTFFTAARLKYNLLAFTAGPVIASSDQGTAQTLVQPEWMKNMTISANNLVKTEWGQEYLSYSQMYGPTVVGFS
jgi:hypothetical protein